MARTSKRLSKAYDGLDNIAAYPIEEAVKLVKERSIVKFDETIQIALHLGIAHAGVVKASFSEDALVENIKAFVGAISRAKPSGAKGTYIKRVSLSSTMGPGLKVDVASVFGAP